MGIMERLRALAGQDDDPIPPAEPEMSEMAPEGDAGGWEISLKKKRRAAVMKQMLEDAGYGELAKMVNIHEG